MYDVDDDGRISAEDLFYVLKLLVGNNLDDAQLQLIVVKTFESVSCDAEEGMDMDSFSKAIADEEVFEAMTISFSDPNEQ